MRTEREARQSGGLCVGGGGDLPCTALGAVRESTDVDFEYKKELSRTA